MIADPLYRHPEDDISKIRNQRHSKKVPTASCTLDDRNEQNMLEQPKKNHVEQETSRLRWGGNKCEKKNDVAIGAHMQTCVYLLDLGN